MAMNSGMAPASFQGLDDTIALDGTASYLDWHGPNNSLVLEPTHDSGCGSRSQAFTLHSMVTEAQEISADPVCGRATLIAIFKLISGDAGNPDV